MNPGLIQKAKLSILSMFLMRKVWGALMLLPLVPPLLWARATGTLLSQSTVARGTPVTNLWLNCHFQLKLNFPSFVENTSVPVTHYYIIKCPQTQQLKQQTFVISCRSWEAGIQEQLSQVVLAQGLFKAALQSSHQLWLQSSEARLGLEALLSSHFSPHTESNQMWQCKWKELWGILLISIP